MLQRGTGGFSEHPRLNGVSESCKSLGMHDPKDSYGAHMSLPPTLDIVLESGQGLFD
jgi:hypothetical protein